MPIDTPGVLEYRLDLIKDNEAGPIEDSGTLARAVAEIAEMSDDEVVALVGADVLVEVGRARLLQQHLQGHVFKPPSHDREEER